jgi:hypothetical protein
MGANAIWKDDVFFIGGDTRCGNLVESLGDVISIPDGSRIQEIWLRH